LRNTANASTDFGTDSSSRFPFRTRIDRQTDAIESPTHAGGRSAGLGKLKYFIIVILFAPITVRTSTSIQLRRAGQQGPTRTLTAALKQTRKINIFNTSPKTFKYVKFTVDGSAFQTFITLSTKNFCLMLAVHLGLNSLYLWPLARSMTDGAEAAALHRRSCSSSRSAPHQWRRANDVT